MVRAVLLLASGPSRAARQSLHPRFRNLIYISYPFLAEHSGVFFLR
jgi:hypothetical protein